MASISDTTRVDGTRDLLGCDTDYNAVKAALHTQLELALQQHTFAGCSLSVEFTDRLSAAGHQQLCVQEADLLHSVLQTVHNVTEANTRTQQALTALQHARLHSLQSYKQAIQALHAHPTLWAQLRQKADDEMRLKKRSDEEELLAAENERLAAAAELESRAKETAAAVNVDTGTSTRMRAQVPQLDMRMFSEEAQQLMAQIGVAHSTNQSVPVLRTNPSTVSDVPELQAIVDSASKSSRRSQFPKSPSPLLSVRKRLGGCRQGQGEMDRAAMPMPSLNGSLFANEDTNVLCLEPNAQGHIPFALHDESTNSTQRLASVTSADYSVTNTQQLSSASCAEPVVPEESLPQSVMVNNQQSPVPVQQQPVARPTMVSSAMLEMPQLHCMETMDLMPPPSMQLNKPSTQRRRGLAAGSVAGSAFQPVQDSARCDSRAADYTEDRFNEQILPTPLRQYRRSTRVSGLNDMSCVDVVYSFVDNAHNQPKHMDSTHGTGPQTRASAQPNKENTNKPLVIELFSAEQYSGLSSSVRASMSLHELNSAVQALNLHLHNKFGGVTQQISRRTLSTVALQVLDASQALLFASALLDARKLNKT